jgi:RimJ/RimL family protein N-acetyltransferase
MSGRPIPSLSGVPVIRTERLVLRGFEARDLPGYVAYRTGPRSAGVGGPVDAMQATHRFEAMIGQWVVHGYGRLAICEGDAPGIGHVGLLCHGVGAVPEMTWTLWSEAHEGRGYATEAARAVLAEPGPWAEVPAFIQPENAGSRRVAERLGGRLDDAPAPPWIEGAVTYRLGVGA